MRGEVGAYIHSLFLFPLVHKGQERPKIINKATAQATNTRICVHYCSPCLCAMDSMHLLLPFPPCTRTNTYMYVFLFVLHPCVSSSCPFFIHPHTSPASTLPTPEPYHHSRGGAGAVILHNRKTDTTHTTHNNTRPIQSLTTPHPTFKEGFPMLTYDQTNRQDPGRAQTPPKTRTLPLSYPCCARRLAVYSGDGSPLRAKMLVVYSREQVRVEEEMAQPFDFCTGAILPRHTATHTHMYPSSQEQFFCAGELLRRDSVSSCLFFFLLSPQIPHTSHTHRQGLFSFCSMASNQCRSGTLAKKFQPLLGIPIAQTLIPATCGALCGLTDPSLTL